LDEQWLGPGEMAKRLGVTAKALRIYEREGLVRPLRTQAGWRAYGPMEAARLHQVLALRRLGLTLGQAAQLLSEGLASLDTVLALQERALRVRRAETERALRLLAAARRSLADHQSLSLDDLATLTKETVMSEPIRLHEGWGEDFKPFVDKHFSPELKESLREAASVAIAAGYDQASISREWEAIFAEARALLAAADETSPRACEMARRWSRMAALFTRKDPEISAKAQAVWADAAADPEVGARMPDVPDLFRFVGRVKAGMVARGEWTE
jgi:DNA-binding transcriptional MerR regulator